MVVPYSTKIIIQDGLEILLYHSFDKVNRQHWESCLTPGNIFLSSKYLISAEKSKIPQLQFRYAILYLHHKPVAVLCFQIIELSGGGEGLINLEDYGGLAMSLSTKLNNLLFNSPTGKKSYMLVCGSMLASGEYGISAISDNMFIKAVKSIAPVKKVIESDLGSKNRLVAFMVKDFYNHNDKLAAPILKKNYSQLRTDPEMIFDVNKSWRSFDDYLAALSSKYRVRANKVLSKLEDITIRELSISDIETYAKPITNLFNQVMNKAPVRLLRPSTLYCRELKRHFGNHYNLKGFFLNHKMIAFTSSLWNRKHYEAHHIGIDYHYNREYMLYQNILYSYIKDAIYAGTERLYLGRTALEMKSTVGAKPHELNCYFRFSGRMLNAFLRPVIRKTGPGTWVPRDPFRTE